MLLLLVRNRNSFYFEKKKCLNNKINVENLKKIVTRFKTILIITMTMCKMLHAAIHSKTTRI